jgi:2-polyprenyl-3-methyl-5-hydroxy-6-metoxy-1,4-benzoquinol methylase
MKRSREYEKELNEDNLGEKYKKEFDHKVSKKVIESFEEYMKADQCLEVGCYDGSVTTLLINKYNRITALDASQHAIEMTAESLAKETSVQLVNQSIEDFLSDGQLENRVDIFENRIDVYFMNIIEHLDDPQNLLISLNENLKVGSRIFIQVPNVDSLSRRIASMMGILETTDKISEFEWNCGHRNNFSFDSMDSLIRKSGFVVVTRFGRGLKTLCSAQLDQAQELGIIEESYLEALFELDQIFPSLSGSICFVAEKFQSSTIELHG